MKVLAFGDSFVKMFIHCEPEVKHWKFKGKSVKGLVKEDDLERRKIQREIRKTQTGTKILMFFGQVDFNYVRYYKVINGQPPITEQVFKKYIEWVSTLNYRKNISIVSIFPSPIQKASVISSLINKGSYLVQNQTAQIDKKILEEYQKSAATWELWNSWISNFCYKYGVNNIKLFKENRLQPEFYDISKLTIHLRYVPVLKLVQNYVDIKFDAIRAQQIQKEYEAQKVNRIANSNFFIPGEEQGKRQNNKNENLVNQSNIQIPQKSSQSQQVKTSPSFAQYLTEKSSEQEKPKEQEKNELEAKQQESALQQAVINLKSQRKQTADLDTDTNLEKQSEQSKQADQRNSKLQQVGEQVSDTKGETESQKKKTKKQKRKKSKNKKDKQKKKYISVEKSEQSEDEGQVFLQLACKGRRKY